jgi:hypothetical protein
VFQDNIELRVNEFESLEAQCEPNLNDDKSIHEKVSTEFWENILLEHI